jgi:hypothetical protein
MEIGGLLKSCLPGSGSGYTSTQERLDFNDPPISIGGIRGSFACRSRLDFNDPPISIGGIVQTKLV